MTEIKRDKKGQFLSSGNPAGRPKGITLAGQLRSKLDADDLSEIITVLINQAKAGDTASAKLILDRVLPTIKPTAPSVYLPTLEQTKSLTDKANLILDATASGNIAPDTASQLISSIATLGKVLEIEQLEQRLNAIERQLERSN